MEIWVVMQQMSVTRIIFAAVRMPRLAKLLVVTGMKMPSGCLSATVYRRVRWLVIVIQNQNVKVLVFTGMMRFVTPRLPVHLKIPVVVRLRINAKVPT
ncbi:MAG: hypothetical protein DRH04_01710 [Deltaproteobacteria bacterium]|nr:MAG: hypothetical protein DRH04_01710 [Deltaproteobacteria bacterium]